MMCQCRFMNRNKSTTLVADVSSWGRYGCVKEGCIWNVSVPPQLGCVPKAAI